MWVKTDPSVRFVLPATFTQSNCGHRSKDDHVEDHGCWECPYLSYFQATHLARHAVSRPIDEIVINFHSDGNSFFQFEITLCRSNFPILCHALLFILRAAAIELQLTHAWNDPCSEIACVLYSARSSLASVSPSSAIPIAADGVETTKRDRQSHYLSAQKLPELLYQIHIEPRMASCMRFLEG